MLQCTWLFDIVQPYKALQMVTFIEKSQIGTNKSASPDKDRDDVSKDSASADQTSESWKTAISQVLLTIGLDYWVNCFDWVFKIVYNVNFCFYSFLGY